jgi:hypothetical protein
VYIYSFFNLGTRWGEWSTQHPGRFTPGKARYPLYRRLSGPQGRSGQVWKISSVQGFDGHDFFLIVRRGAPDDGWKYHPKHVEQFPDINKLCNVASCCIYIGTLLVHPILHISRIRVKWRDVDVLQGGREIRWKTITTLFPLSLTEI